MDLLGVQAFVNVITIQLTYGHTLAVKTSKREWCPCLWSGYCRYTSALTHANPPSVAKVGEVPVYHDDGVLRNNLILSGPCMRLQLVPSNQNMV